MTAREFAKMVDFEIEGKLTKKIITREKYSAFKGEYVEEKIVCYLDEAENEFHKTKSGWVIITADGGVI